MEGPRKDLAKPASSGTSGPRDSSQNVTSRMLNSASGLLRDALSPNRDDSARTLSHALAGQAKAGPSAAGRAQLGHLGEPLESVNARKSLGLVPDSKDSFREFSSPNGDTNPRSPDIANGMSLDEFMYSAQHENEVPNWQHNLTAKGKQKALNFDAHHAEHQRADYDLATALDSVAGHRVSQNTPVNNRVLGQGTSEAVRAAKISESDGADVIKLLQDTSLSLWTNDSEDEEKETPYTITEEDMKIAEALRSIDSDTTSGPNHQAAISAAKRGEPFPNFLSFFDDLENYQVDVWGYIMPLVEKAKRESTVSAFSDGNDGPATRRLRMILAHIDGSR